ATEAEAKVRRVVDWAHEKLKWTYTDYKSRTVDQILERGGGNCDELARVVIAVLKRVDVRTRRVHEINIQPESLDRQASAEAKIKEKGPSMSVFGKCHNDHVWLEFTDGNSDDWRPADPTLRLVGVREWIGGRVGFGERPTSAIILSKDMIVPVAIFAITPGGLESRTEHYLVQEAPTVLGVDTARCPGWERWTNLVRAFDPKAKSAMEGKENLHDAGKMVDELAEAYGALRACAPPPELAPAK
ncbi:MAG: transglutaminase domain-containing protein, partial [Phycisphaerales bacterium]|nr:transglutaminase domain-containing protein [Phycisphaerales bacterium]